MSALALVVLAATAWMAGSLLTRPWLTLEGRAERIALPVALGLAVLAHLGFLLGALGLLRPGVLIAVVLAICAGSWTVSRGVLTPQPPLPSPDPPPPGEGEPDQNAWFPLSRRGAGGRWERGLGGEDSTRRDLRLPLSLLVLLGLAPLFVLALYPPTAFDETLYHLPFARAFAQSGSLPAVPSLKFPVFPALAELLFAEVLLLAGDVATHLVSLLAVLATAGLLAAWGRKAFSPGAGWIAAALYLGNPIVAHLAGTAYVEPLLALFVTGALFAAWMFRQSGDRAWLLAAAAFAGSAAGVKYLGLFFAATVFVDLLGIDPKSGQRKLSPPILFALVAFVVLVPTYARIAVHTGNPIFPYLPGVFGSTAWDPTVLKPMGDILVPETLVRFIRLPWDVVFHRSAVGQQPPFSPLYLPGLLLLLAGALRDSRVRHLVAIPFVWAIVFLFLPPDSRFLVPILPPLSLALAGALSGLIRIEKRSWLAAACALAILPGELYAGYRIARQGPPPATEAEREAYLTRKLPLYPAIRHLDRISTVAYAFHAENMKYFYDGALYGDWIGPESFSRFRPLVETPAALHREFRKLGATHLLLSRRPGAIRAPGTPAWNRLFRQVYEDPAAEIFVLVRPTIDAR